MAYFEKKYWWENTCKTCRWFLVETTLVHHTCRLCYKYGNWEPKEIQIKVKLPDELFEL